MRTHALLLLSSLALASCARTSAPPPTAAPAEEVAAPEPKTPEPATAVKAAPPMGYVETNGAVPSDVSLHVEKKDARWSVRLTRHDHIVMIREGERVAAGDNEVTLEVDRARAATLYWEATHVGSLLTTRGVLRVDTEGETRVKLAEPPVIHNEEERRRHGCSSFDDTFGGYTVICRVTSLANGSNLFGEQGVTRAMADNTTTFRFDLPALGGSSEAFAFGYVDRGTGVVVRVEASQAAGEARPTLAVLSADRDQPAIPRFPHHHHRRPFPPDLL